MKRRVLILVMALILLVTMIPVPAFAASDFKTSAAGVDLIKYFEGFSEYPYWDYKQWTVGYGTLCPDDMLEEYKERGITVEEAEALLQEELAGFESTLNKFIDKYGLKWSQAQFDAMVSFTYNCGGNWTTGASSQLFTQYVVAGKTGNDFLFAIAQWSNAGGSLNLGLVKRRLIEANLYLNGIYDTKVPENYDYVKFSHTSSVYEGKSRSIKIQGYDSNLTDAVRPVAQKDGYRFLGWYTAAEGGERIDTLTARQAGKTLYPHWEKLEDQPSQGTEPSEPTTPADPPAEEESVIATGTIRTSGGALNIRSGAGSSYSKVDSLANGTKVEIYEIKDGWGRIAKGWISMDYVVLDTAEPETVVAKGIVSASSGLNIRSGAGSSYSKVGSLEKGDKVELYEIVTADGLKWGRVSKGWISLKYVKLASVGTVTAGSINVRKGAGTGYDVVGSCKNGERVYVYETKTVGSSVWGHIDKGWLNMKYVTLDGAASNSGSTTAKGSTGYITATSLSIRKGAGTGYDVVGKYQKGDVVTVYETKKVGTLTWGRTGKGWISMKYVQLDADTKPVTGTITASSLNIRKGPGSGYSTVGSYRKGDKVSVYQTMTVSSIKWGRTEKGWINMAYVQTGTNTAVSRTGTVTGSSVNVRKGAGSGYAKVGSVKYGEKLTITALKLVSGTPWGKISGGWVCLDYVKMNKPASGAPALIMGDDLNIRKGAGKSYAVVGQYDKGTVVTILETKSVSGTTWGRTGKGWVSMDYVL